MEGIYTSTNLEGSEKLATGVVKTLPSTEKTTRKPRSSEDKSRRPRKRGNRRGGHNRNSNAVPKGNVYESNKTTTVRRRSRKIDSGSARPGQNSSGLRKTK